MGQCTSKKSEGSIAAKHQSRRASRTSVNMNRPSFIQQVLSVNGVNKTADTQNAGDDNTRLKHMIAQQQQQLQQQIRTQTGGAAAQNATAEQNGDRKIQLTQIGASSIHQRRVRVKTVTETDCPQKSESPNSRGAAPIAVVLTTDTNNNKMTKSIASLKAFPTKTMDESQGISTANNQNPCHSTASTLHPVSMNFQPVTRTVLQDEKNTKSLADIE